MSQNNHSKAQILIADDEPLLRDILSRKLNEEGYKCLQACDGLDALKKLGSCQIELVLLDLNMPGKSGIEVLQDIKVKYPDTAVIMVTAMANVDLAINALKMGAYDYIIKPVDQKILLISIERAMEARRIILENKDYHLNLEKKVEEQTRKIRESSLNAIKSLAYALEAKDKYTSGHSKRTTDISVAIAEELSLPQEKIEKIRLAGLLHDLGKIGVRDTILDKAGKLTAEEFAEVRTHSEVGERILKPVVEDLEILEMVRHHHERYDGKGYPDGLRGDQISQGARVLAVADAYYAMTSDRPYRSAMTVKDAVAQLESGKQTQFDSQVVDAFLRALAKGKIK
jgi:putative two-component system response regulator